MTAPASFAYPLECLPQVAGAAGAPLRRDGLQCRSYALKMGADFWTNAADGVCCTSPHPFRGRFMRLDRYRERAALSECAAYPLGTEAYRRLCSTIVGSSDSDEFPCLVKCRFETTYETAKRGALKYDLAEVFARVHRTCPRYPGPDPADPAGDLVYRNCRGQCVLFNATTGSVCCPGHAERFDVEGDETTARCVPLGSCGAAYGEVADAAGRVRCVPMSQYCERLRPLKAYRFSPQLRTCVDVVRGCTLAQPYYHKGRCVASCPGPYWIPDRPPPSADEPDPSQPAPPPGLPTCIIAESKECVARYGNGSEWVATKSCCVSPNGCCGNDVRLPPSIAPPTCSPTCPMVTSSDPSLPSTSPAYRRCKTDTEWNCENSYRRWDDETYKCVNNQDPTLCYVWNKRDNIMDARPCSAVTPPA